MPGPARRTASTEVAPVIDLDAARASRAETAPPAPMKIGGKTYTLPSEVPIDVFGPIYRLNFDFAVLVQQALSAVQGTDADAQKAATTLVIDMLVANPNLPTEIVSAILEMGVLLLGQEAMDALVAFRPTREDVGVLAKGLFAHYGLSLGEASTSTDSSVNGGGTSKPISSGSTTSTSEGSSESLETPAS